MKVAGTIKVQPVAIRQYCLDVLQRCGVRSDVAFHVAEGLTQASLRGVDSHGLRLLPHYIRALKAGRLNPDPEFRFERTAPATGRLDGDHTFGHAAGAVGMEYAITLARESGMGSVSVYNSSHFGAAAYFALMAAEQDMIGLSLTHADSLTLSYGGTRPYFGTNPICFAAPSQGEEPFCLDMATSLVTWNKVLQVRSRGETVPENWGVDDKGEDVQDPHQLAALHPIGGYKGFGLAAMVEVLCGVLSGMPFGRSISRMYADPVEQKRYLGHFFLALRIDSFMAPEEFKGSMKQMTDEVRLEPASGGGPGIQVAGDPEKRNSRERSQEGIPLSAEEMEELSSLAAELSVEFPAVAGGNRA